MRLSTRVRRTFAALAATALVATGALTSAAAANAVPPPPTQASEVVRMAALGDSITQALMSCSSLSGCPANSWSTGSTASVSSHLLRLKVSSPTLVGYNDSVSGAASGALDAQAQKAVTQNAQYVTIEIGANDACTRTVTAMTPTATYKANVLKALTTLANNPNGAPQVFVAGVPSLLQMYNVSKNSATARFTWSLLGICQSMLANPSSTKTADVQRRAAVQQRVNEYNAALAEICTVALNCRYDGGVVANYAFKSSDISTRDYFHPSLAGQATLAAITWPQTQWVKP